MKKIKILLFVFLIVFLIVIVGIMPIEILNRYNKKLQTSSEIVKDEKINLTVEEKRIINKKFGEHFSYVLNNQEMEETNFLNDLLFKYNFVWNLLSKETVYNENIDMYGIGLKKLLNKYYEIFHEDLNLEELNKIIKIKIDAKDVDNLIFYGLYPKGQFNLKTVCKINYLIKNKDNILYFDVYDISNIKYSDKEYFNLISPDTLYIDGDYRIGVLKLIYNDKNIKDLKYVNK